MKKKTWAQPHEEQYRLHGPRVCVTENIRVVDHDCDSFWPLNLAGFSRDLLEIGVVPLLLVLASHKRSLRGLSFYIKCLSTHLKQHSTLNGTRPHDSPSLHQCQHLSPPGKFISRDDLLGDGSPADAALPLQDTDRAAALGQVGSGRQAVVAAANHDRVVLLRHLRREQADSGTHDGGKHFGHLFAGSFGLWTRYMS